jgi:hypothetical protein
MALKKKSEVLAEAAVAAKNAQAAKSAATMKTPQGPGPRRRIH